ncbi:hypothetical protein PtrSN002B_005608 [Pyrenophora tritici-repentis]|uniref:Uncharacterized protein n=3 Tax=Pyrenophora tritici-repentis TaxID=45151 RepID=A0A2W1G1E1_9PLEO|nr:uncharacterized protein PTRG_02707 [Pyrenophora tritici-repentis Pt-1C-BFP]KAA8623230.1 hypothetical protein PtrV1_04536 [Pyrenophora tritici-repentis]EDU45230.1 conserved hypothetical protein [Pyrenophora tritici-repentis Pt-1C-BFP]KAF7452226.1 hypothetical protein A1F99_040030 [Pyrenophora tritici-repentis]KAF7574655.1 hypothetical protein PtrM4_062790 [Pyrenophora tritici-repentis]KAI0579057.1 hypothetical protein Alg215_06000 [Pyrenophora tritici-repentis]
MESPFVMPQEDVEALGESKAFCALRRYLAGEAAFCATHAQCTPQAKQTWLLHRDILHALIMPVVTLFSRASTLASAALCTQRTSDLELAFSGESRSAFIGLQCFLSEEADWCRTRGCPACVVSATLSTDSHIRLTIAASLLSTASVATPTQEELRHDSDRTLPPLPHILPALQHAVINDPFWEGSDIWGYILSRATQLSAGIQALIAECVNLESLVSSPTTDRPGAKRGLTHPSVPFVASGQTVEEKGVKLRKSKLAKRQLRLRDEEVELMRRVAMQCWAKAQVPKKIRGDVLGISDGKRTRSLTCP